MNSSRYDPFWLGPAAAHANRRARSSSYARSNRILAPHVGMWGRQHRRRAPHRSRRIKGPVGRLPLQFFVP